MATQFVIPSIFTAIDKLSGPLRTMQTNVGAFASKAESSIARSERSFRKLTPALGDATKQFLSFASAAAISGAAIAGGAFSIKALMDYESELANLQAITGATGKDFDTFKTKISEVANVTKKSSVEVAQAFTAIANNQPELLKDAAALAAVTQSSILLAQASKMELQPAGEALTQILNQFGKGAKDAAKTVDILAAGSVAGSSEIRDTAEAIKAFGTVAANAGVKIDESVALIELASKFEKGSEAGVKLRNILITMSAIKVQDPKALKDLARLGVNMDIVSNSSLPLADRLKEISKISADNAALFHVFGKENQAMAAGVLSTSEKFGTMLNAVQTSGEASRMAAKNNDTLAIGLQQLKAKWINMITGAEGATTALDTAKKVVGFLIRNMETIVSVGTKIILFFAAWKALIISSKVAMFLYNVAFGINNALQKRSLFYTEGNVVAKTADLIATKAITAAQWLWNAAMSANPIGLVIIAIAALTALVVLAIKHWDSWGQSLSNCLGPLGLIIEGTKEFSDNWGLVEKAFEEKGMLGGIQKIGDLITSVLIIPMQKLLELIAAVTGAQWATDAATKTKQLRYDIVHDTDSNNPVPGGLSTPALNPRAAENDAMVQRMISEQKQQLQIDINDRSNGKAKISTNNNMIPINISQTNTWQMP